MDEREVDYSQTTAAINSAIAKGQIPDDIAKVLAECAEAIKGTELGFHTKALEGPARYAELVLKLGYWLAIGKLTPFRFRDLQATIPHTGNFGWDVLIARTIVGNGFDVFPSLHNPATDSIASHNMSSLPHIDRKAIEAQGKALAEAIERLRRRL